ncbi:hypothetical protein BKA82DRAFT_4301469, partial [Pisolithus tinctorius]
SLIGASALVNTCGAVVVRRLLLPIPFCVATRVVTIAVWCRAPQALFRGADCIFHSSSVQVCGSSLLPCGPAGSSPFLGCCVVFTAFPTVGAFLAGGGAASVE